MTANDEDSVGGTVRYRLTDAVPFSAITQFSVNRTNGQISLLEALDRETDSTITLIVTASDMGEPGRNVIMVWEFGFEGNIVVDLPKPKVKKWDCGSKVGHFHIRSVHFHIWSLYPTSVGGTNRNPRIFGGTAGTVPLQLHNMCVPFHAAA